jgi:NTP pyrophosphatase (non-canonical NTP hydrolase)
MSKRKLTSQDELTTISELKSLVEKFVLERDWAQFHSPKNLAMAIGVEAGELMDLFRWHSGGQSIEAMKNATAKRRAGEELADIVICALGFANRTGVDLAGAVRRKVAINQRKYPVRRFRGRF